MENEFIKRTRFSLVNSDGDIFVSNISINNEFVKKAENDFKYDKAIIDYIDTKLKPVKGKSYLLINAMGASDYFGSNMNADWFSEPVLEDFHKTFENYGRVYRHHVNKDESIAEGKVIFSSYNKKMHRVELIVEVDEGKVKDILDKLNSKESVATSMAAKVSYDTCLALDTPIYSSTEVKLLEHIEKGDSVFTHTGTLKKVLHTSLREIDEYVKLKIFGDYTELKGSLEHPFQIAKKEQFLEGKTIRRSVLKSDLPLLEWVEMGDLRLGDYLVFRKTIKQNENQLSLNFAKILGYYLSEGWLIKRKRGRKRTGDLYGRGVSFSFNLSEKTSYVQDLVDALEAEGYNPVVKDNPVKNECKVSVHSVPLSKQLLYFGGEYSKTKFINPELFSYSEEFLFTLLGSLINGDGSQDHNKQQGAIRYSSVSEQLGRDVRRLCLELGIIASIARQNFTSSFGDGVIFTVHIPASQSVKLDKYSTKIVSYDKKTSSRLFTFEDFILIPISAIEITDEKLIVKNLQIEDDESYQALDYVTHNCSICGNKAKSRKDYCMHLKYFKNKIHSPSTPIPGAKQYGQKVYAINPDPKFFDISFVKIPADATSSVITKLAEAFGKESVIKKEIIEPMKDSDPNIKVIPSELIDAAHGSLTKEEMRKLLEKYSSADIMTHMVLMNMIPSRKDFQYMHLVDNNLEKYAEILYDSNIVFDCTDVEPDATIPGIIERTKFNPELGNELSKFGERIGMGEPLVVARILTTDFEKSAQPKDTTINTVPYFLGVGGAYYGYNKYLDAKAKSGWGDFSKAFGFKEKLPPAVKHKGATWLMRQHPLLLASGLVGTGILSNYAQKSLKDVKTMLEKTSAAPDSEYFKKIIQKPGLGHFLTATAIASPLAFLYSSHNRNKMSKGEEVSALGAFAARHPYITALGGVGATYIPKKIITTWDKGTFGRDKVKMVKTSSASDYISYIYHYDSDEYEKIYSDLINY